MMGIRGVGHVLRWVGEKPCGFEGGGWVRELKRCGASVKEERGEIYGA